MNKTIKVIGLLVTLIPAIYFVDDMSNRLAYASDIQSLNKKQVNLELTFERDKLAAAEDQLLHVDMLIYHEQSKGNVITPPPLYERKKRLEMKIKNINSEIDTIKDRLLKLEDTDKE